MQAAKAGDWPHPTPAAMHPIAAEAVLLRPDALYETMRTVDFMASGAGQRERCR